MKRLLLLVCALAALTSPAWAGGFLIGSGSNTECSPQPTGTILTEGFESEGTPSGWTVSGDSTTFHISLSTESLTNGSCRYGIRSDTSNESGERAYFDNTSALAYATYNVDVYFSLYVNSWTIDSGAYINILAWSADTGGGQPSAGFRLIESSGNLKIIAFGNNSSTSQTILTNTWYLIKIHIDTTLAESYIQVDGGTQYTFERYNYSGRYLIIGSIAGEGATEGVNYEIGYVSVNAYTD